jgi:hypothetical protein
MLSENSVTASAQDMSFTKASKLDDVLSRNWRSNK